MPTTFGSVSFETARAELFQRPVAIGAIGRSGLLQAVQRPGELVNMTFAPGLAGTIVDDAGTSDALPLLAYLLQELYFGVGRGGTVTEERYHALGGVAGALSRQADQVMTELRGEAEADAVFAVLLRFVTMEGQEATRRRVALGDLTAGERRVVDAFVDARLLVTDAEDGRPYAHVAHEALMFPGRGRAMVAECRVDRGRAGSGKTSHDVGSDPAKRQRVEVVCRNGTV